MTIGIGSEIWRYDENRRVYSKDGKGGPLFREKWHKVEILGETSRSWITSYYKEKVPKKGAHPRWAFAESEIDDACFVHDHRWKIIRAIERVYDADALRQIAAIVGYQEKP